MGPSKAAHRRKRRKMPKNGNKTFLLREQNNWSPTNHGSLTLKKVCVENGYFVVIATK